MHLKILLITAICLVISGCNNTQVSDVTKTEVKERTSVIFEPVPEFTKRITLKKFGTYVEPGSSPVDPERFQGFHTGVDVEFPEENEVPVKAIANGEVLLSRTVSGYGGVVIIKHEIDGQIYSALYGHLDPASLTEKPQVEAGEQIGVLGEAYTEETDNERKHLHFSIKLGTDTDLKGYVSSESQLSNWIDPKSFF